MEGTIIKLSNGVRYLCASSLEENGREYLYLVSVVKPIEVRFGKREGSNVTIINELEEKKRLAELFRLEISGEKQNG